MDPPIVVGSSLMMPQETVAAEPEAPPAVHSAWLSLLVLQPSPFCNINCDYCYLPDRSATHRMSMETLQRVVDEIFASDLIRDTLTIVWHAGEPLAVPIQWYREAFECIRARTPSGVKVLHSFQSNGTLLNQAWCDFIKEEQISIGLSIDGPESIHDIHRKTRSGKGTHAAAMRGAKLLLENGIYFHVISVISADSLGHADAVFDFFCDNGMHEIGFNVEEIEAIHEQSSLQERGSREEVAAFLRRIFERQRAAKGKMVIREFDFALHRIRNGSRKDVEPYPYFNEQVRPFGIISVDWQGRFSTFSPELLGVKNGEYRDFLLGNFHEEGLLGVANSEAFQRLVRDVQTGVEQCRANCRYFELCGGGAPGNKFFENGSFATDETMYCRYSIQLPIDLVLEDIEVDLAAAQGND